MVSKPDFKRIRKKALDLLKEDPGTALFPQQIASRCREQVELVEPTLQYVVEKEPALGIKVHIDPEGQKFYFGELLMEKARAFSKQDDQLTKDLKSLYYDETHKRSEVLPEN